MELRNFLKLSFAAAAGVAAIAVSAQAAPLAPQPLAEPNQISAASSDVRPTVTDSDEVANLKPEQVRWHRHWHHHWRRWHHWHRHW
jgi:hypothetical protein